MDKLCIIHNTRIETCRHSYSSKQPSILSSNYITSVYTCACILESCVNSNNQYGKMTADTLQVSVDIQIQFSYCWCWQWPGLAVTTSTRKHTKQKPDVAVVHITAKQNMMTYNVSVQHRQCHNPCLHSDSCQITQNPWPASSTWLQPVHHKTIWSWYTGL